MSQSPGLPASPAVPGDSETLILTPSEPIPRAIQPDMLLINTYRVERPIGRGGVGEVYLARHILLGTLHAIKVVRALMASDELAMGLFYREAMVLRELRHDAVVHYDGFVRDDQGRAYLIMEYVEGCSLAERLRHGPLTVDEILTLRDRLCSGLAEAHRKGAVHRDLSPDNVILPGDQVENAKLIDFGLCKLTDPDQVSILGASFAGKYRYASPEQFGLYGGVVDARSDLYSLGLVLAATAVGRPLDMGDSYETAIERRKSVPDLARIPVGIAEWLSAMLQPNPAQRPASVDALLARWPSPTRVHAGGHGLDPPKAITRDRGGRRWLVPTIGGALLLIAAVLAWFWPRSPLAPPSEVSAAPEERAADPARPAASREDVAPAPEAETSLERLISTGRLDEAFAIAQDGFRADREVATAETLWELARQLRRAGKADQSFAVTRTLAEKNFGPAVFGMAEFYDPRYWAQVNSPFSKPNPVKAREWYERAAALGVGDALARLDSLRAIEEGK